MAADKFVSFRVDLEMKKLLQSLADREGITESRFLRRLLEPVINSTTLMEPPAAPREIITRDKRLAIRLQAEDRKLLSERAEIRGVHSATYVALLVRSHLRAHPPLPAAEYLALKQSVAELRAVGRNLNQIARLMNQGGVPSPSALTGELAAVKKLAPDLRDRVLALVEANERSWLAGDGKLGRRQWGSCRAVQLGARRQAETLSALCLRALRNARAGASAPDAMVEPFLSRDRAWFPRGAPFLLWLRQLIPSLPTVRSPPYQRRPCLDLFTRAARNHEI